MYCNAGYIIISNNLTTVNQNMLEGLHENYKPSYGVRNKIYIYTITRFVCLYVIGLRV